MGFGIEEVKDSNGGPLPIPPPAIFKAPVFRDDEYAEDDIVESMRQDSAWVAALSPGLKSPIGKPTKVQTD